MYAQDVAAQLNLELQEFRKIEDSIASVLRLKKDEKGNYVYMQDHIDSLREVFSDLSAEEFIPLAQAHSPTPQPPQNMPTDELYENGNPKAVPLPVKESVAVSSNLENEFADETGEDGEKTVRSAIPFFERVSRDEGTEERTAKLKNQVSEITSLVKMIQDQRIYFERKIQEIEEGDLKILREENLRQQMGTQIKNLIRKNYAWENIINQYLSLYNSF